MIIFTICALAAVLSSLVTVNGAVVQREAALTSVTSQPAMVGAGGTTTTPTNTSSVPSTVVPTSTAPMTSLASTPTTSPSSVSITFPATSPTTSPTTTPTTIPTAALTTTPTTSATSPTTTPIPSATTTTPTVTPTVTPGAANCDGLQQWQSAFAYTAGDRVIFNNQLYTAKQWTYDNAPPVHPDQWTFSGACAQPINNKANCNGVAAWQRDVAYTTGSQVTFNNHLWSAVQWSESNSPGDASGSWKDLGACA